MIFVFLVDTSVSMEHQFGGPLGSPKRPETGASDSLFSGTSDRFSRRWQRKGTRGTETTGRITRLDCAKSIVEQIVHSRENYEHDRYMLVSYHSATATSCIRTSLKDSRATLLRELKKLRADDKFSGGSSLTALFNQLALMRGVYDLDTYGYGRYPQLNEPVHIMWLTDGASVVGNTGVTTKLNLPVNNTPWVESYIEPFRWDQRMTLVLLHEPSDTCLSKKHSSEPMLMPMCTVMGGTVHHLSSMHLAMRFVEGVTKARVGNSKRPFASAMPPPGVLVSFERIDDNPANPGNSDTRVLLHAAPGSLSSGPLPPPADPGVPGGQGRTGSGPSYGTSAGVTALVNGQSGYFPIPEPFWPEIIQAPRAPGSAPPNSQQANLPPPGPSGWQIPRRAAHPILSYSQNNSEWSVPANFPFDKYQIDGNTNVAKKLLAAAHAAQAAHEAQGGKGPSKPVCWQVFINGSYTNPKYAGFPFGILRANSARTAVNLFVFPYNFTALWKILAKLETQVQAQRVTRAEAANSSQWKAELEEYLQHTPGYYAIPLKRAFNLYGIPHHVFPRNFGQSTGMRNIMHYSIKLHTIARREWDRLLLAGASDPATKTSMEAAEGLQSALLEFDPAADVSHMVTNAFDVDRAHCLATLSAMRRVFVRECMASHRAYSRPNAMVPPSLLSERALLDSANDNAMDVDDIHLIEVPASPQYTPPVASMEYSFYGFNSSGTSSGFGSANQGSRSPHLGGMPLRSKISEQDLRNMDPGTQLSPMGGIVDVASEDDRDTRHSVSIRDMSEYSAAMNRQKSAELRDPLLDGRIAAQRSKTMFGNPYERTMREPRSPANNVLAGNPMLGAKLGLSRSSSTRSSAGNISTGPPRSESEDEAAVSLEMESEAEINEMAVDKMLEDMPMGRGSGENAAQGSGRFGWMQRKAVPRRRSISTAWHKNDESWNVNPWAILGDKLDPGALAFTSDAVVINRHTAQILHPAGSLPAEPTPIARTNTTTAVSATIEPPIEQAERVVEAAAASISSISNISSSSSTDVTMADVEQQQPPTSLALNTVPSPKLSEQPGPPKPLTVAKKVSVADEKTWFQKRIKADPAHYDEAAILKHLADLRESNSLSPAHLKIIVNHAVIAAKAMRRKQLVEQLTKATK